MINHIVVFSSGVTGRRLGAEVLIEKNWNMEHRCANGAASDSLLF
jgi:hypothetical protein